MPEDDRDYYYRRAEEELARAQASTVPPVVSAHYHLAGLYLDKLYAPEVSPSPTAP